MASEEVFVDLSDDDLDFEIEQNNRSTPNSSTHNHPHSNVAEVLGRLGARPKPAWLSSCMELLRTSNPSFATMSSEMQAQLCFSQLLYADFNVVGDSVLPPHVNSMHKVELPGPFILQVDEISDIGSPLRDRYQERNAGTGGRCLKLSMTDGVQRVFGIEYRPIPAIKVLSAAGFKVVVQSIQVRRGLLLLVPEVIDVLGGLIEQLEAARQQVVEVVNKPPRGNRAARGGNLPKLAERATAAAWSHSGMQQEPNSIHTANHGSIGGQFHEQQQAAPDMPRQPFAQPSVSFSAGHFQDVITQQEVHTTLDMCRESSVQPVSGSAPQRRNPSLDTSVADINKTVVSMSLDMPGQAFAPQHFPGSASQRRSSSMGRRSADGREQMKVGTHDLRDEGFRIEPNDAVPFTYLAILKKNVLQADQNEVIKGRIKCVLTGVKEFHFKGLDQFRLLVYVDDGSSITEALINHEVVENLVGYSPAEVSAALASAGKQFRRVKDSMKQFQAFLTHFEGYMEVEFSKALSIPIVVSLKEAFEGNDAVSLLTRVMQYGQHTNPIEIISP